MSMVFMVVTSLFMVNMLMANAVMEKAAVTANHLHRVNIQYAREGERAFPARTR